MQRTIAAMVVGRRRWLERMRQAKALGLIDKIPTGRRRAKVRAAPNKAIARARGIALHEFEARPQHGPAKPPEQMSLPELMEDALRAALRALLAILDQPAGDNLESQQLQMKVARDLLSLRIGW
jgi:hypothetical protein